MGRENIFKPIFGNESLHQDSNEDDVENSKLCHRKNKLLRARCSHTDTYINTRELLLVGKLTTSLITY